MIRPTAIRVFSHACAALFTVAAAAGEVRTWADSSGVHRVEAELVELTADSVVLKTVDGRIVTVPTAKLSSADRAHVARLRQSQAKEAAQGTELRYEKPTTFRVRRGLEVVAEAGPIDKLVCTFPIPMEWPEQKVKVVAEDVSRFATKPTSRVIGGGVRQYEFRVQRLPAGESAHVILTLEIERRQILPPEQPEKLVRPPRRSDLKLRPYLGESPFIETKHPTVRAAAEGISLDESQPAWRQVETIYDWTLAKVKHDGTKPLKGALRALTTGSGDCEERTSLFVAMCRLKGIPARSVWVQGHAYPEFYLQDAAGGGHWVPCESLGERNFGGVNGYRLILQKGDNFRMSQKPGPQRYVTPTASGMLGPGSGQPVIKEIQEQVEEW